ncbi:hypothetical protein H0H92_008668, partial [Tricholoma furcatifolium]
MFWAITGDRRTVNYAHDVQGRHFAIKAILDGSEEFRILRYLKTQGFSSSVDKFSNVIPVLDLLPCEGHWLAVMPRDWRTFMPIGSLTDIKMDNVLVNHFDNWRLDHCNSHRTALRNEGKLIYAIFDFSHSTMFSVSATLEECRLPSIISWKTLPSQRPSDTMQAELDFNPFAFDVGMLGVLFCSEFQ